MSEKLSLYKIDKEIESIIQASILDGGEVNHEQALQLELMLQKSEKKVTATAHFIAQRRALIKNAEAQAKEFKSRIDAEKKRLDWLEKLSIDVLQKYHNSEVEDFPTKIKLAKCPPSVIIEEEKALPCDYIETKTEQKINKKKIKEDLQKGRSVPGARLETDKVRLQITGV